MSTINKQQIFQLSGFWQLTFNIIYEKREIKMKIGTPIILKADPNYNPDSSYTNIRDMALLCEKSGLDSIWFADHLLYREKNKETIGIWECWTVLSALAEATSTIELGTLAICNNFRNPTLLAKMAHTIDEVSNGRFILGIGAGWKKPEHKAFGFPFDHRVDRFEEALQIIRPLLKDGYVDFVGNYYQARNCEIIPRSPRPNGPPLLVGAFRSRMMRITAKYADMWNIELLTNPYSVTESLSQFHEACTDVGRDPASIETTFLVPLVYPDLAEPPRHTKDLHYISGSPEEVATAMRDIEALGVSQLLFQLYPYKKESISRLAEAMKLYRKNRI